VDTNQVVADCLVLVSQLLQQRQITVTRDCHASVPVGINRQELQQVVINLLINAIQAMPAGQQLHLSTRDWLGDHGEALGAVIEVQDEGSGLTPEVRARLFSPFFTTKNDGNGLGLWISLGLVERYGGRLEADNRPHGQGAVFRIKLWTEPRVPDAAQASTADGRPGRLGQAPA
jgi:two-component system, NtrC family, sensor kinase